MLARSLEPLIAWGTASVFGSHGFEGVRVTDVAVRAHADPKAIAWCLERIEGMCEPSEPNLAAKKLAELRVLTVHRARDAGDMELMAGAYTQRLAEYPADIVVAACDGWANREEFWPSWAELKAECDKRMRGRAQIRIALRAYRASAP